jgi:diaminohydroxyphosphoribosylaminopyrimidine deaminase/5-amino-6-(5-phosphoribosylamino)uracil reductase
MQQAGLNDHQWMQKALALAEQGRYSTRPNPAVGCVIVKDGRLIAEGWHVKAGEPHAEVLALAQADKEAKGATAYVTLEPCSHFGKTPPCANALVASGVSRVVIAMQDPNPLVAGKGIEILRQAGIVVDVGIEQEQAQALNKGFIKRMKIQRPVVRVKLASSVDGKTAMASGESVWITGNEARQSVHLMRAQHGAIVTGIGTVLADDPQLNARLSVEVMTEKGLTPELCHPIRVVLDPNLSMPLDAKMLSLPGKTLLMTSSLAVEQNRKYADQLIEQGAEIVAVQSDEERLDLQSVLEYLAQEEQVNDVMVEAGAIVAGAFIEAGLVDELHWYLAPHLMGHQGKPLVMLPSLHTMQDRIELVTQSVQPLGRDFHFVFSLESNK